jgi:hypothetical protein
MKTDIIKTLFSKSGGRLQNVQLSDLNLPKAANRSLSNRKIASLALKAQLFVTSEQRNYYPQVPEGITLDTTGDEPVVKKVKKSTKAPILNSRLLKSVMKHKVDSSSEKSNVSTHGTMFAYFKKSPPVNTNVLQSKDTSTAMIQPTYSIATPASVHTFTTNTQISTDMFQTDIPLNAPKSGSSDISVDNAIATPVFVDTFSTVATRHSDSTQNLPQFSDQHSGSFEISEQENQNVDLSTNDCNLANFISPEHPLRVNLFKNETSSSNSKFKRNTRSKGKLSLIEQQKSSLKETFSGFRLDKDGFQMESVAHYQDSVQDLSQTLSKTALQFGELEIGQALSTLSIQKK